MSSNTLPALSLSHRKPDLFKVARGVLAGVAMGVAFGLGGFLLEKIGVETEHEYLFEEVKRKIEGAK